MSADGLCAACGSPAPVDAEQCPTCSADPRLRGRYRLLSVVGHGAVGTTYRALDGETGDVVAVKEMNLRPTTPADQVARIEREARVLAELDHPRIPGHVEHFAAGQGKHRAFYLVQSFIEGPTLAKEYAKKRYTEDEVLGILDEICGVLEYLHGLAPPVIHRDIKPKNLIRNPDGELVLIDFGAVRDVVQDPTTGGSTVAGTYGYMAPEQFKGDATPRSDLYAVGAIAVELLSRQALIDLVGVDHQLDWKKALAHTSEPTKALIGRLLSGSPEMRPASAKRVRAEIARIRAGDAPQPGRSAQTTGSSRGGQSKVSYRGGARGEKGPRQLVGQSPPVPRRQTGVRRQPVRLTPQMRRQLGARQKHVAMLLAFVGGFWGLHNWYLGRYLWGVLSFIFSFTFIPLAVSLFQGVRMTFMSDEAFDDAYNPALAEIRRGDTIGVVETIRELKMLMDDGALSRDEFEAEKARLLGRQAPNSLADLGRDILDTVIDQVNRIDELPPEVLKQLGRSRAQLERTAWKLKQQNMGRYRGPQQVDRLDQLERRGGRKGRGRRSKYLDRDR